MTDRRTIVETGAAIAEQQFAETGGFRGKNNAYECRDCKSYIVTVDRDFGVTPFLVRCGNCGGLAQSKFYRVQQSLLPTHEWYRPSSDDAIPPGSEDHVRNGGLVLRAIAGGSANWLRQ